MLTRLIISLLIIALGVLIYQIIRWRNVRRASQLHHDPVLASFVHGRPAILYFTSEHCAPCRTQQRPALNRLIEQFGDGNLQIIQVDADIAVEDAKRWGVMTVPTTFVLDSKGQSKAVNYGVASAQKLLKQLSDIAE